MKGKSTDIRFISKKQGFTLLELLIAVAIIGVLASLVLMSVSRARERSRDARRISDMKQIKLALELYFNVNGYYPPSSCGYDCNGYSTSADSSWTTLHTYLSPYISKLPVDPRNVGTYPWVASEYTYVYGNVGRYSYTHQYDLTSKFESSNHPLSCGVNNYYFFFNSIPWCGSYPSEIYEASQN